MKNLIVYLMLLAVVAMLVEPAFAPLSSAAQLASASSSPIQRRPDDLEKLVAPMALYPDPLIAVMLPAATHPVEIVQAARFVANSGNPASLDGQPWDANVKALARFPSVIQKMHDDLAWTVELGQAFTQQPLEVMDAIQALRARAQSAGVLQTTPEQVVTVAKAVVERTYETQVVYVTNTVVEIRPANQEVIYVPTYNPAVIYAPPPAYVYGSPTPVIVFGAGVVAGPFLANYYCDWYYGGVYYGHGGGPIRGGWYTGYPYYRPPHHYPYQRPPWYHGPPPYGHRPPPHGGKPPSGNKPPPGNQPPTGNKPPPGNQPPTGGKPPGGSKPPSGNQPPSGNKPPRGNQPPRSGNKPPRPVPNSETGSST